MESSTADEMYSGVKTFITLSESKPPFSNQSYGDYIWFLTWNVLMNPHSCTLLFCLMH